MIDRDGGDGIRRPGAFDRRRLRLRFVRAAHQPGAHRRHRRGRRDPGLPAEQFAARAQRRRHARTGRRAGAILLDVVAAGPGELDGPLHLPRDDRGLDGGVIFDLAAETATDEHRIDRHLTFAHAHRARDGTAREAGRLGWASTSSRSPVIARSRPKVRSRHGARAARHNRP